MGHLATRIKELELDYSVTLYMVMHARDPKTRTKQQTDYVERIRKRLSDAQKTEDECLASYQQAQADTQALFEDVHKAEELLQHFEELEVQQEAEEHEDEDDRMGLDPAAALTAAPAAVAPPPAAAGAPGAHMPPAGDAAATAAAANPMAVLSALQATNTQLAQAVHALAEQMTVIQRQVAAVAKAPGAAPPDGAAARGPPPDPAALAGATAATANIAATMAAAAEQPPVAGAPPAEGAYAAAPAAGPPPQWPPQTRAAEEAPTAVNEARPVAKKKDAKSTKGGASRASAARPPKGVLRASFEKAARDKTAHDKVIAVTDSDEDLPGGDDTQPASPRPQSPGAAARANDEY